MDDPELCADRDARLRAQRPRRARHRRQPDAADDARRCLRTARARRDASPGSTTSPCCAAGRCRPSAASCCTRPAGKWESSLPFSERMHLTTSRDILDAIAAGEGPESAVIALGYAGWEAGQLEEEMARNAWLTVPRGRARRLCDAGRRSAGRRRPACSASTCSPSAATRVTPEPRRSLEPPTSAAAAGRPGRGRARFRFRHAPHRRGRGPDADPLGQRRRARWPAHAGAARLGGRR